MPVCYTHSLRCFFQLLIKKIGDGIIYSSMIYEVLCEKTSNWHPKRKAQSIMTRFLKPGIGILETRQLRCSNSGHSLLLTSTACLPKLWMLEDRSHTKSIKCYKARGQRLAACKHSIILGSKNNV